MTSPKAATQELKDRAALFERIDKTPLDAPELFIVSGDDAETFDQALDRIKARILQNGAGCHVAVFGNEPDDDTKFITEIENVPLFAPYRLIILRDAQQVLAKTLKQSLTRANLKHFIAGRPDRTWIVLHYLDENFKSQKIKLSGFAARVVMHEVDHLDGVLFVDKLDESPQPVL